MMGRELEPIPAAAAGAIVGISGLENFLAKNGTLSSTLDCPAFFRQRFYAEPIIRVAVEPADLKDIGKLADGLKLLHRSDPSAKTYVQDTGEHVLVTAGEVHLQRCLDDLRRRFAKVDFKVSAPIVPFLETIVAPPKFDMVNESIAAPAPESGSAAGGGGKKSGTAAVEISTANKACLFRLRAAPIPAGVVDLLLQNEVLLNFADDRHSAVPADLQASWQEFGDRLRTKFAESESEKADFSASTVDRIWAFGPRKARPNLLINMIDPYKRPSLFDAQRPSLSDAQRPSLSDAQKPSQFDAQGLLQAAASNKSQIRDYDQSVVHGFHLRCQAGPLCEEPLRGVAIFVEAWDFGTAAEDAPVVAAADSHGPISGQIMATTAKEAHGPVTGQTMVSTTKEAHGSVSGQIIAAATTTTTTTTAKDAYGPISGQIIATIKEGCKQAFQAQPQRLMMAMYSCQIQATADVLGKVYSVLNKRGGKVSGEFLFFNF